MSCTNTDSGFAPFCEPTNNTIARPGDKVAVTWDPSFFDNSSTLVQIQADFRPLVGNDPTPLADDGFTSNSLRAGTGSYSWAISDSILNSTSRRGVEAQLYIVVPASDGGVANRTLGPLVRVVPMSINGSGPRSGPNLVAIIVPVVVGVLLLMAVAAYIFVKMRNPGWKLRSVFGLGNKDGYGSRKSRAERTVAGAGAGASGLQMGDIGISRPTNGRNVFRDEMRRQEETRI